MKYILILLLFGSATIASAQQENRKFYNITEVGYLSGIGQIEISNIKISNEGSEAYRLRTLFGIFIKPQWSVGLGIGLDGYGINTIPLFVDTRYYMADKPWFSFLDLGYSIGGEVVFVKGAMLNVGFGIRKKRRKTDILIAVGYNLQQIRNISKYTNSQNGHITLQSISINLGLLF